MLVKLMSKSINYMSVRALTRCLGAFLCGLMILDRKSSLTVR